MYTPHKGDSWVLVQNGVSHPTPREFSRCANTERAQAQLPHSDKNCSHRIFLQRGSRNHRFDRTPGILESCGVMEHVVLSCMGGMHWLCVVWEIMEMLPYFSTNHREGEIEFNLELVHLLQSLSMQQLLDNISSIFCNIMHCPWWKQGLLKVARNSGMQAGFFKNAWWKLNQATKIITLSGKLGLVLQIMPKWTHSKSVFRTFW